MSQNLNQGIAIESLSNSIVNGNVLKNPSSEYGIALGEPSTNWQSLQSNISGNTIEGAQVGLLINGGHGTITGNTFSGSGVDKKYPGCKGANALKRSAGICIEHQGPGSMISGNHFEAFYQGIVSNSQGALLDHVI